MKRLILPSLFFLLVFTSVSTTAQTCDSNLKFDSVNNRYTAKTDGTVTDKETGLTWMRCALGQTWDGSGCVGLPKAYSWKSAENMAEATTFAGKNDWRIPEQEELQSLFENHCYRPFINLVAFPNPSDTWFWTGSANPSNMGSAWIMNFFYEYNGVGNKNDSYAVRLVRDE
jgi:hypothetical protein